MVVLAIALAVCLIAGSPQRLVGDGREYLAQAINFASFHGPALRPADIPDVQSQLARFDPALGDWDIRGSTVADRDRGRAFLHFWFYALLAAPGLWITNAIGVSPTLAFTALNLVLLGAALWCALPRAGPAACVLLFGGPLIWWIDKAHTEVFTFALLTIALTLMRDRPWWSMLAAAAAAVQNPPVAVIAALVFLAAAFRDRSVLIDRRMIAGTAGAVALASLHPLYSLMHYGTPSLLLMQTRTGPPTIKTLFAVVADPTLGLVGNFPLFLLVVASALGLLARQGRRAVFSDIVWVPFAAAIAFLFSFSRTTNLHHGGTPSLSRYALWLVPLAFPLLSTLQHGRSRVWPRLLWTCAGFSFLASAIAFNPSVPQNSREPTWLATFLWTHVPAWNNPLPEVFIETELHVDEPLLPVATEGCEKILIAGGDTSAGLWPTPCYPAPIPAACERPDALCYANRVGRGYDFVPADRRSLALAVRRRDAVWPADALTHVRRIYDAWDWPTLRSASGAPDIVRAASNVSLESVGSGDRFILVLINPGADAVVRLRPAGRLHGILVDARTGRTLREERYDGSADGIMNVEVPSGFDILLLAMRADPDR